MLRTTKLVVVFGIIALFANTAEAASLFFTPQMGEFGVGKEISVDLKIDSEGVGLNAAQATIRFPKDTLTVKSIDKTNSTFNFWLEEPTFSNEDGVISFVGGTPFGVSGASLSVMHIVFTSKGSGAAPLTILDAAISASDGSGTNILSKTNNAVFTISPTTSTPTPVSPTISTATTTRVVAPLVVVPPTQIVRTPAPASGLPEQPKVHVSLYPDPTEWYNTSDIFTVAWDLPLDVSGIATALNKQPNYTPIKDEGLFDSKMFDALADGVWYIHVQFKNKSGRGITAHYRLAVDTKPPLPFEITSSEGEKSDNPTPSLTFKASDALSGIREYRMSIDGGDWLKIPVKDFTGSYKLVNQNPGKHHIVIQAVDNAGNSIENTFDNEVLPLALPTFTFSTEKLFSDEAMGLSFKGTALPSTHILFLLKKGTSRIAGETLPVDAQGNWEYTFNESLRNGTYTASIQNTDARGALSLLVTAPEIKVTGRYTNLLIFLFIVLIGALGGGYWIHRMRRTRTTLRIEMAERDASNVFNMIKTDIQKLQDAQKTATTADDEFIADKLKKSVEKMGSYIKSEIGRAKE